MFHSELCNEIASLHEAHRVNNIITVIKKTSINKIKCKTAEWCEEITLYCYCAAPLPFCLAPIFKSDF